VYNGAAFPSLEMLLIFLLLGFLFIWPHKQAALISNDHYYTLLNIARLEKNLFMTTIFLSFLLNTMIFHLV